MRPRIAFFGNCQAAEIQRIALAHAPLTAAFEVVPVKPVYEMTADDKADFCRIIPSLDILACQYTMEKYSPADNTTIRSLIRGRLIEFPSMWFGGHLPDIHYMTDPATGREDYHSLIITRSFFSGMSLEEAVAHFESPDCLPTDIVDQAYTEGIAELKRREQRCEVSISDLLEREGPSKRLFHTMNHPCGGVVLHAMNQILKHIGVDPVTEAKDGLAFLSWPICGAVAQRWSVPQGGAVERGPVSTTEFIARRYAAYQASPGFFEANRAILSK